MSKIALFACLSLLAAPAAALDSGQSETASKPKERVICKKVVDTGSLVKGKKKCMSAAHWDRVSDASRERAKEMQQSVPGQSN
jgi:hypothetical protein